MEWNQIRRFRKKIHPGLETGNFRSLMVTKLNKDIKNDCLYTSNLQEKEGQFQRYALLKCIEGRKET